MSFDEEIIEADRARLDRWAREWGEEGPRSFLLAPPGGDILYAVCKCLGAFAAAEDLGAGRLDALAVKADEMLGAGSFLGEWISAWLRSHTCDDAELRAWQDRARLVVSAFLTERGQSYTPTRLGFESWLSSLIQPHGYLRVIEEAPRVARVRVRSPYRAADLEFALEFCDLPVATEIRIEPEWERPTISLAGVEFETDEIRFFERPAGGGAQAVEIIIPLSVTREHPTIVGDLFDDQFVDLVITSGPSTTRWRAQLAGDPVIRNDDYLGGSRRWEFTLLFVGAR